MTSSWEGKNSHIVCENLVNVRVHYDTLPVGIWHPAFPIASSLKGIAENHNQFALLGGPIRPSRIQWPQYKCITIIWYSAYLMDP